MSAPLPEYTFSGSYSSDRLRGARPLGSPLARLLPAVHEIHKTVNTCTSWHGKASRGMKSGHEVHEVPEQLWIHGFAGGYSVCI